MPSFLSRLLLNGSTKRVSILFRPNHYNFVATRTMTSEAKQISAPPAENQVIDHDGKRYTTVREGQAFILVPESAKRPANEKTKSNGDGPVQQVFYNPIQQFNRDLTVLALKAYGEETIEKRKEAYEKKLKSFAGKKRKRAENKAEQPSEKALKTSEGAVLKSNANGDAATGDIPMPNADETSTASEPAAEEVARVVETEAAQIQDVDKAQETTAGDGKTEGQPRFTVLDALSATGLRALRYAHELPFITQVTANDLLSSAVESIKLNIRHNKLEDKITATKGDALAHMYTLIAKELSNLGKASKKTEKYDVIDLDPYGTAATFLDAAVQAVRDDGGLLCVTCTDAGVWASNGYPEKAFALYGGIPMKGNHSHEGGLRLILNAIATSASRYGLTIEPLLSLSIDFYARVFVRVKKSPASVKFQAGKTMVVYSCDQGCGSWTTQLLLRNRATANKLGTGTFYKHTMAAAPTTDHLCEHCGYKMHLAGPMYAGPLHSEDFIKRILDEVSNAPTEVYGTLDRVKGMLTTALEEQLEAPSLEGREPSKDDAVAGVEPYPFFFLPTQIARALHCATPGDDAFRGALRHLGYQVTRSHCKPGSIKTDAPWTVIWDIMREWIRQKSPIKEENIKPGTTAYNLLRMGDAGATGKAGETVQSDEEKKFEVIFDEKLGRETSKGKLVRYQQNPRENWGPLNRARGH